MKNLLLYSLLALLLAPGAVATESPAASDDHGVSPSHSCSETQFSLGDLSVEDLAAQLDRIGAKMFEPDAAQRMSVPACPDIQPCTSPCQEGDGPCFIKPFGSSECCTAKGCFQCEGGTSIFIITCPCFGRGCPSRSLDIFCD